MSADPLLFGRRFRIVRSLDDIESTGISRRSVSIPVGTVVKISSAPWLDADDVPIIDVLWGTRILSVFIEDLRTRADEIVGEPPL